MQLCSMYTWRRPQVRVRVELLRPHVQVQVLQTCTRVQIPSTTYLTVTTNHSSLSSSY